MQAHERIEHQEVPAVADGRVFVATTNSVAIFGLLR
jgi:hypothetical protein